MHARKLDEKNCTSEHNEARFGGKLARGRQNARDPLKSLLFPLARARCVVDA